MEQEKIVKSCKKILNSDVVLVAMYQGFRRGEVLGLTRDCIDFENKTITINKAWSQYNVFDTTKNAQSMRTLPMFDKTYKILLKYKKKLPNERIFDISTKQCEKMLRELRKEIGMEKFRLKDMRSTFITNCMNLNIPIHIIQSWVGHVIGSVVTTSIYTTHHVEADTRYIKKVNSKL